MALPVEDQHFDRFDFPSHYRRKATRRTWWWMAYLLLGFTLGVVTGDALGRRGMREYVAGEVEIAGERAQACQQRIELILGASGIKDQAGEDLPEPGRHRRYAPGKDDDQAQESDSHELSRKTRAASRAKPNDGL